MIGHQHHRFLMGKTQAFVEAISRAAYFDRDRPDLIGPDKGDVLNEFRGAAIIGILSYFEEVISEFYNIPKGYQPSNPLFNKPRVGLVEYLRETCGGWGGWPELDGLMRIRHCFGHSAGRILDSHETRLREFETWLKNENALENDGSPIKPYFELDNGKVRLKDYALHRCRIIATFALNHCGFIGPIKIHSLWLTPR